MGGRNEEGLCVIVALLLLALQYTVISALAYY